MAYGKKTGGRNFKPGDRGNPKGRPPLPDDVKAARKLTKAEFERIAHTMLAMSKDKLKAISQDPNTPLLELLIASIISKGVNEGDEKRLNFFIDRLVGKLKDQVDVNIRTYAALAKSYGGELGDTQQLEDDSEDQSGDA